MSESSVNPYSGYKLPKFLFKIELISSLTDFKNVLQNNNSVANSLGNVFTAYIEYLPFYSYSSLNGAQYRVLVEFERHMNSDENSAVYNTYSTMEILRP